MHDFAVVAASSNRLPITFLHVVEADALLSVSRAMNKANRETNHRGSIVELYCTVMLADYCGN